MTASRNHALLAALSACEAISNQTYGDIDYDEVASSWLFANAGLTIFPDALSAYMPRQCSHFCKHPYREEFSWIKLDFNPDYDLSLLSEDSFRTHLCDNIPTALVDETSYIDMFAKHNPKWSSSPYMLHLMQDAAYDKWIREKVDVSRRFENIFTYRCSGTEVSGEQLREDLLPLDDIVFCETVNIMHEQFDVIVDADWLDANVNEAVRVSYSPELARKTTRCISFPNEKPSIENVKFVENDEDIDELLDRLIKAGTQFLL